MQTVCRHVLTETAPSTEPSDKLDQPHVPAQSSPPARNEDEWYEIEKVLKEGSIRGRTNSWFSGKEPMRLVGSRDRT
jgi:hypothetical protein